jgi:cytidylate kinase
MVKLGTIEAMLEHQARFAELRERILDLQPRAAGRSSAAAREGPWITVSSEIGSGGTTFARRIASALDWQAYDREILQGIAEHTHTREAVAAWMDEKPIGPMSDYLSQLLDPQLPGELAFLQEMARVIVGIARKGHAVIVGRGANHLLDPRFGLRLRVVAPLDQRAIALAERASIGIPQARRTIKEHDERQREFIHKVFSRSLDDPLGYDMVLNLGAMDHETAKSSVLAAAYRLDAAGSAHPEAPLAG